MNRTELAPTAILNYSHTDVQTVVGQLGQLRPPARAFVQAAHGHISDVVRPVYSIDEFKPASETLRTKEGSCGQRMACLEALCRGYGIPTRVRALWLDRRFWYSRLPLLRFFLPERTLMPWPQFQVEGQWIDFDEIYGSTAELAARASHPFTNKGESMFDAVQNTPVDFLGKSKQCGCPSFDLSGFVVGDDGIFDTRDELVTKFEHQSWFGSLMFSAIYGGRPVRRIPE
jgi:hypothetical protein